jgi:hypothetical protein
MTTPELEAAIKAAGGVTMAELEAAIKAAGQRGTLARGNSLGRPAYIPNADDVEELDALLTEELLRYADAAGEVSALSIVLAERLRSACAEMEAMAAH